MGLVEIGNCFLLGRRFYLEVFQNLIGMVDEGGSIADELVGSAIVIEGDATGDDVERSVEVSGVGGGVEGTGWEGCFDDKEGIDEGGEDSVAREETFF